MQPSAGTGVSTVGAGVPTAGQVFRLVLEGRTHTRAGIGRMTGLSRTAVTTRIGQLLTRGLLVERADGTSTGGRPAARLAVNTSGGVVLAAAIGRSRAQLGVCDLGGTLLAERSTQIEHTAGPRACIPPLADELAELLVECGQSPSAVRGIGVSLPATVDVERGYAFGSIVLPSWDRIPLAPLFAPTFDVPVAVDRDVNVMAVGERTGSLRDIRDLLMIKASTGIGAGIVSGGVLQRGDLFAAGELGHIPIRDGGGLLCRCGQRDCLEAVAGGWAMVKTLQASGRDVGHVRDVVRLANAGDAEALDLIRTSGRHIGEVVAGAVTLLNPDVVVIGGDLVAASEPFLAGLRETVYRRSTALATRQLRILPTAHGERCGLIGCAALILERALSAEAVDRALAASP